MKKYIMILSVLAFVACNNAKTEEALAKEAMEHDNLIRQHTLDSLELVKMEAQNNSSTSSNTSSGGASDNTNTGATQKKGMSNKTKGALIGAGAGIVGGAATGAAVSKDKAKGAIIGGVIGGAVGSGVGYGIGANKDKKDTIK